MTDKEKAKAYDEALKKASFAYKDEDKHLKATLEKIFPELKGSDDEKIRNFIINELTCLRATDEKGSDRYEELTNAIDWLEKQGKTSQILFNSSNTGKSEQKSSDKPRFKIGDWVVNKFGDSYHIDSFDKKYYHVSDGNSNFCYFPITQQGQMRLWTIQDAKDGDVLSFYSEYKSNKIVQIGIIEKYVGKYGGCSNTFKIYAGVNWDNNLQIGKYMGCSINMGCSNIHPATKEQRDTLMKAMNDAGYEWDVEKKELKKED